MPGIPIAPLHWWQTRWFMVAAVLAAAIPLLWPAIPPLIDVPGHIGRYRIMAEAGQPPLLDHYAFHWALIGNLGVDALVLALRPLIGLEPAAHLIIAAIPALTVAAMLWAAREAHGRLPATAAFAFPLAYTLPLQLGFVNFALSAALALGGLALWLHLARRTRPPLRALLFAPIACLVWLCHSFGWAMLGMFVFGAEWALRIEKGERWWRAAIAAALMCVPMALPVATMVLGGGDQLAGPTGDWFNMTMKAVWILTLLRERWEIWDIAGVAILAFVLVIAVRSQRCSFSPLLGVPAVLGALAFVVLPRFYDGGSYVDMRVLPSAVALAILAIRAPPTDGKLTERVAGLAGLFFAARTITSTIALLLFAHGQAEVLGAISVLPPGAGVLVLVNEPAPNDWRNPRFGHIADLAIARRRIFTNEQWALPGQQLVRPLHPNAAPFDRDPSQIVYPAGANYQITDFDQAIASFDRGTFGYVWTIGFPTGRVHASDLVPIRSDRRSTVYRVVR